MRTAAMRAALAALAAAATLALAGCQSATPAPASSAGAAALAQEMFELTNREREADGLPAYEWSPCLASKAEERAAPFVDEPVLTHDLLVATCTPGVSAGENLSRSDLDAAGVVGLWMDSPGHRANLLSADFATSGIACFPAADGLYACSQLFEGTPAG